MIKEQIHPIASNTKLQLYRHNYGLVCMTGLLGCRWHRYQQSTRSNRKRDVLSFWSMCFTYFYSLIFFYFWLVVSNDTYFINSDMFQRVGQYIPWYGLGLGLSSAIFVYLTITTLLGLLHILLGHQIYIHPFHQLIVLTAMIGCISVTVLIGLFWPKIWPLVFLSLKVYGPYLQIIAIVILTPLSWLLYRQWFKLSSSCEKALWMFFWISTLLLLYLSPLAINSPLVKNSLPEKPKIIAMGGAAQVAPENTIFAFQKAIQLGAHGLYTTLQISLDDVPFLMTDKSLLRTTDVLQKYQSKEVFDAKAYSMAELKNLSAGSWFLENDPCGTVGDLTASERSLIERQEILTWKEFLTFMADYPQTKVFLEYSPMSGSQTMGHILSLEFMEHPNLNKSNFYFPVNSHRPVGVSSLVFGYAGSTHLKDANVNATVLSYDGPLEDTILQLHNSNIHTIITDVNSNWLLSIAWCLGLDYVATYDVRLIQNLNSPLYQWSAATYLGLWITVDLVSFIITVFAFIFQRIQLYGTNFSPESISLNTGRSKTSYRSRTMKEKLLRDAAALDTVDDLEVRDSEGGGVENKPAYTTESAPHSLSLSSLPGTLHGHLTREGDGGTSVTNSYSL